MKIIINILILLFSLSISKHCYSSQLNEISIDKAIAIASDVAAKSTFDVKKTDVEILRVKNGIEKGPLRIVLLSRLSPEIFKIAIKNEFFVVYFYPKDQLKKGNILGGDFTVFVDLYSGEVLYFSEGL